jgi:DNA-binding transcriptional ArsR family regulator
MDLSDKKQASALPEGQRASQGGMPSAPGSAWTFLSNHAHVLVYLAEHPSARLRDVAADVGITERSAMRLITQLDEAGIIRRTRQGRRNHYMIDVNAPLKHPLEAHCTVGQLLEFVASQESLQRLQHQGRQAKGKES